MVDNKRSAAHSGPARRSVVASAWAAPVILTAAAAPAASASTAGFDIALDPPQMGDSITAYNGDFTHIYSISGIMAWVVANHGSAVAPGGFPMSLTCDKKTPNCIWWGSQRFLEIKLRERRSRVALMIPASLGLRIGMVLPLWAPYI